MQLIACHLATAMSWIELRWAPCSSCRYASYMLMHARELHAHAWAYMLMHEHELRELRELHGLRELHAHACMHEHVGRRSSRNAARAGMLILQLTQLLCCKHAARQLRVRWHGSCACAARSSCAERSCARSVRCTLRAAACLQQSLGVAATAELSCRQAAELCSTSKHCMVKTQHASMKAFRHCGIATGMIARANNKQQRKHQRENLEREY